MAFPTGWGRKCVITVPDVKIIGNNTDYMAVFKTANFPTEMLDGGANSALNGGGDVRFSLDSLGATQLAVDIRRFVTGGTPDAEVKVMIPNLNTGAARSVWAWYKKAAETQPAASSTYGSDAANSKALRVLALDEDPAATAPQFVDRTANTADGTAYNTTYLSSIADGVRFANTVNTTQGNIQSAAVGSVAAGALVCDLTVSTFKDYEYFVKSRTGSSSDRLYLTTNRFGDIGVRLGSTGAANRGAFALNTRTAVAFRWASGSATVHKNGANQGATYAYSGTPGSASEALYLGTYNQIGSFSTTGMEGDFFGFWFFDTDPGQDYLNTFTGMLADPAAFATAGTPEDAGGGGSSGRIMSSIAGSGGLAGHGGIAGHGGGLAG